MSEEKVARGFDRGGDYEDIKNKLVTDFNNIHEELGRADNNYTERIIHNKLVYCVIAMIQLRNGSRISEACKAASKFFELEKIENGTKVVVKISKSEKMQYNRNTKKKTMTKARYREMVFPMWLKEGEIDMIRSLGKYQLLFNTSNYLLTQRVRDYLFKKYNINTHTLRYAFINYMIHDKNKPMNEVAKFVGHKNTNQICTYTQNKNVNKIFDMDI